MSASRIQVKKRNGKKEDLDLEKIHRVVFWATENISGVSPSEVEIKSHLQFYDGMPTKEIQETLIKSAADLISEETPNYQYVAGRLINYALRKEVYGEYDPLPLKAIIDKNVAAGFYTDELLQWYSQDEWIQLGAYIKHERDAFFTYAAMEQWRGKYLVQNRATKTIFETPQVAYMLIAATLFNSYPVTGEKPRIQWVKDYYDAVSQFQISLPTPIMAGVRTPQKQFSSCVLIETDDSLDSINATSSSIVKYVSQKAGIGVNVGKIRAIGSPIRKGDAFHTGIIPFLKLFQSSVKSCSQGGVRGGAATFYYPVWHLEVEDLLVLKNNKGTEDNRVRHVDYGVQFNKVMYERLLTGGNITLFSPSDVPGLYDAFFVDNDKFRELYEAAEADPTIRKKTIKAIDLFSSFMQERKDTGRIYLMNVDHVNSHGSFKPELAPIKMSNLCLEVTLPTQPIVDVNDDQGEIALCTLSAINLGMIKDVKDFEKPCMLAVRALDALLDYQNYPVPAARKSTMNRRPLGIGLTNLAYWLAKNDLKYSDPAALARVDEISEAWSYYLIKASVDLAKEKGACPLSWHTKYHDGIVPVDTRKPEIDELVEYQERMPWAELRNDLKTYGIRNSTLMAVMPVETSSQILNSTNGIEPVRGLITVKQSKDGILKQVVPDYRKLKNKYELLWDQTPEGYLKIAAVIQKYMDQTISTNTSYNPQKYAEEKIPMSEMLTHILMCYKYGIKTLYYFNTNDSAGEIEIKDTPALTEIVDDEENCDSCKL